ncbi:unnamed protein product [Dicrocoelium dendriticum]|nr:unnamed protein product [Dicrocoelium dendriticum]
MDGLTTNGVMILRPRVPSSDDSTVNAGSCGITRNHRYSVGCDLHGGGFIACAIFLSTSNPVSRLLLLPTALPLIHSLLPLKSFPPVPFSFILSTISGNFRKDSPTQSHWREVSICGSVYEMRNNRSVPTEANRVDEDNVLLDKTLIDLCGVTLLWRSGSGLLESASANDLRLMVDGLNLARFQCPVLYRTLRLPAPDPQLFPIQPGLVKLGDWLDTSLYDTKSEPYVYLSCGHVHGWHTWTASGDMNSQARTCPLCLQPSPFVPLRMGLESAFYIDRSFATHCFNPCGHMASEATVRFWCSVRLPTVHSFDLKARCPFCLVSINPKPVQFPFWMIQWSLPNKDSQIPLSLCTNPHTRDAHYTDCFQRSSKTLLPSAIVVFLIR